MRSLSRSKELETDIRFVKAQVERKRERGNALVGKAKSPARLGHFFV
jgi:hypothetical protein